MSHIAAEMIRVGKESVGELRSRISAVEYDRIRGGVQWLRFRLDGSQISLPMRGRNRDLLLGFSDEQDRAIALRVLLDEKDMNSK